MQADTYEFVERALEIRAFELELVDIATSSQTLGPVHTSLGHEVVAISVCAALTSADWVFPYYRSHSWLIARGCPMEQIVVQLTDPLRQRLLHLGWANGNVARANAIVGQHLPVALGAAVGLCTDPAWERAVAVAPVGDGGMATGVAYETLLAARKARAPLLVCVEDNEVQNFGTSKGVFSDTSLRDLASATGVRYIRLETESPTRSASEAIQLARNRQPVLLHAVVTLEHPHSSGPGQSRVMAQGHCPRAAELVSKSVAERAGRAGLSARTLADLAASARKAAREALEPLRD